MSIVTKAYNAVLSVFDKRWYTQTSATTTNTPTNPIIKSLDELNGKYHINRTNEGLEYIRFGANDDIPEVLDKLRMQSPTHSGILLKKAKMVAGNKLEYSEDDIQLGRKTMFNAFYKNCEAEGIGIRKVFNDMAFHYEEYGGVYLYIKWNSDKTRIVKMEVLPYNSVRVGNLNTNNKIDHFVVRRTFKKDARGMKGNESRRVEAYKKGSNAKEEIIYIKNPYSVTDIYGVPNYLSAFYFISADYEFGQSTLNGAKNGFQPKVIATMVGRNMTDEQKAEEHKKFMNNFTGSDGDQVLISWVRKMEEAPNFEVMDVKNLDKTVNTFAELNDNKIITAHNVTSPNLFGINKAGKLNQSTDEMRAAYQMFRATETLPNRELLLTKLNDVMAISGYGKVQFKIIDLDTDPDTETAVQEDTNEDKQIEQ